MENSDLPLDDATEIEACARLHAGAAERREKFFREAYANSPRLRAACKNPHNPKHAGDFLYVFEHEVAGYEAKGWICTGTMPGHHAERGWIVWRPE